ncbi:MAG: hypothetical protein E2O52_00575 [Gammaproteobacteria bacterium]|nr:MAG: hypothetical protein E2O52_00575 [Gammaproteobacteria bacterium]
MAEMTTSVQENAANAHEANELSSEARVTAEQGGQVVGQTISAMHASQEQSTGIIEVNKSVTQMDEMTQQNAALVEQASAASTTMGQQASELAQQVSFFKIGESSARTSAPEPASDVAPQPERRQAGRAWSQPTAADLSATGEPAASGRRRPQAAKNGRNSSAQSIRSLECSNRGTTTCINCTQLPPRRSKQPPLGKTPLTPT